jgi:hypothetical protein
VIARRSALAGVAALIAAMLWNDGPARAQAVTINGVEFRVRSATLYGNSPNLRIILAVTNKEKDPVGVFLYRQETSASLDTGLTYHGYELISSSGIGVCGDSRDRCPQEKQSFVITIPSGITGNVTLEFQGPSTQDGRMQAHSATLADFSGTMYLMSGNGEAGYVPLPLSDIQLRNTLR